MDSLGIKLIHKFHLTYNVEENPTDFCIDRLQRTVSSWLSLLDLIGE
jgi:hypothetical protein